MIFSSDSSSRSPPVCAWGNGSVPSIHWSKINFLYAQKSISTKRILQKTLCTKKNFFHKYHSAFLGWWDECMTLHGMMGVNGDWLMTILGIVVDNSLYVGLHHWVWWVTIPYMVGDHPGTGIWPLWIVSVHPWEVGLPSLGLWMTRVWKTSRTKDNVILYRV